MLAEGVLHQIFQMPQFVILMGMSIPIIGIVAGVWCKVHKIRSENELKRSMVERGMSVEEMERVLAVRSADRHRHRRDHD